jgi:prepilin-type processing-associated H-X9-DG protein
MRLKKAASINFRSKDPEEAAEPGFTLVELLAVIMMATFILILVCPSLARAKQKAKQTNCQMNLKQMGLALQSYANANGNFLPGPVSTLVIANYDFSSSNQLIWFIADNLGSPKPSSQSNVAPQLLCPAYRTDHAQPGPNYVLNDGRSLPGPPFGHPNSPVQPPLKLSAVAASVSPAACFAVADADKGNVNAKLPGRNDLPYTPVHGKVRNQLFFDWHVATKGW